MTIYGEVLTAMVTPFNKDLSINYGSARRLARYLIENGSDGLVVLGTTGEVPTLTIDEKLELLRVVKDEVGKEACIIAGTGSNNTQASIDLSIEVEKIGVDGVMIVGPYYNKPPQDGFYQHFKMIADAISLPIMIYNVPGRTAKNIEPKTIARLAEIPNIVAIKEASGDLEQVSWIRQNTSQDFKIYSGEDSLTLPILAVGGIGIVSVASHVIGRRIKEMIQLFKLGKVKDAALIHSHLFPVFKGIFVTTNPIPIKMLLNELGHDVGSVRPPLTLMSEKEREFLLDILNTIKE